MPFPANSKFAVDKVCENAATVLWTENFFIPAATVISAWLNYASAGVSGSVRVRQVQGERAEREGRHAKFRKPRDSCSRSRHIFRQTRPLALLLGIWRRTRRHFHFHELNVTHVFGKGVGPTPAVQWTRCHSSSYVTWKHKLKTWMRPCAITFCWD